jgi:AhpD family alkylhydroperoxidase
METKNIDPALGLMRDFANITQGATAHIQQMRKDAIYSDGAVAAKWKALGALLWSVSARCEPCIKWYVQQAVKQGASEQELGEFLAVALTMGGCVGEMWALKAYQAYKDITSGNPGGSTEPPCCQEPI